MHNHGKIISNRPAISLIYLTEFVFGTLSYSIESSATAFFINGASWLIIQSICSQNIIRESNYYC